jgi:hypothetical protein
MERSLKSYDDIAQFIVDNILLRSVHPLPETFWNALSPYSSVYRLPLNGIAEASEYMSIELVWNPPSEFQIRFLNASNETITLLIFRRESNNG